MLIFPLDQAIYSLVRCKILENAAAGGGFSTEKSEITLSGWQIHVHKQHTCIVWLPATPPTVYGGHLMIYAKKYTFMDVEFVVIPVQ